MKKLFLMSAFALMGVAANASTGTVVSTSCGKQVMTVGPEYFDRTDDFVDYLQDLNDAYCGSRFGFSAEIR